MDVLDKLGVDWKLLLAQGVNFLILLWVLRRYAYKPMIDFLESRSHRIDEGLKNAKRAAEKLSEMEEQERAIFSKAHEEARTIVTGAQDAAKQVADRIAVESRAEAERIIRDARAKIEREREAIRSEMAHELAGLVLLATEKVLGEKMRDRKDEDIVKEAVKAL